MILPVVFIVSGRFVKNKYFEDSIANINKVVEVDDYVLILTCWKCPECHAKLPQKSMELNYDIHKKNYLKWFLQ